MGDYKVSTTNIEIELGSPTLVNLTKFAGTTKNLVKSLWEWFLHVFLLLCVFHNV